MALTMVSLFGIGGTEIQGKSIEINEDTFPNLEKLDCSENNIEKLDVSKLKT